MIISMMRDGIWCLESIMVMYFLIGMSFILMIIKDAKMEEKFGIKGNVR